jgi:hypothetical protein
MTLRQRIQVVLLLLLGSVAIAATYTKLSYTADEVAHVYAGMEWWQKGTYTFEPMHTPLTRIVQAAPNHLFPAGAWAKSFSLPLWQYKVVMPRLANLAFFLICGWLVFHWSRTLFGYHAGLWSLLLYVSSPIVLGHSGVATTDMGYTAMFLLAVMTASKWLDNPSARQSVKVSVSVALMLGAKLSGLVQWPAAMIGILAAKAYMRRQQGISAWPLSGRHFSSIFLYMIPVFFIVLALLYRGDIAKFFIGIGDGITKNRNGHALWLFGPLNNQGVWYFFPVVFFFKTQLPFQIAAVYGMARIIQRSDKNNNALALLIPAIAAFAFLLVSMTSNINLGIRHVLPMLPLLSIPAGYGMYCLWQSGQTHRRFLAIMLLGWQLAGVLQSHPEYIAYYNEAAGARPERISHDSDFDWGQSIIMLNNKANELGIDAMYVCVRPLHVMKINLNKMLKVKSLGCPANKRLDGWVAVSRVMLISKPNDYGWLEQYAPYTEIGDTMYLYNISPEQVSPGM